MNIFLILAFLFFSGSIIGWIIEVIFRRFFSSSNPQRKWINPGFCVGPYLPIYGIGLCIFYLIARVHIQWFESQILNRVLLFIFASICMTILEYIAGIISLKWFHIRLWDYCNEWGNIQGVICPRFSLAWCVMGAIYYFFVHPSVLRALLWLSHNLAFSFFIGFFFGIFLIDFIYSANIISKIRLFAKENNIEVRLEQLKLDLTIKREEAKKKAHFFFSLHPVSPMLQQLQVHAKTLKKAYEQQKKQTAERNSKKKKQ